MEIGNKNNIYVEIKNLLENAKKQVLTSINSTMTMTYYLIGKRIVEEEQLGDKSYGKYIVETLSTELTEEFGKNFSKRNIYLMIKFYQIYSQSEIVKSVISQSQNPFKLSWTHYIRLVRIINI